MPIPSFPRTIFIRFALAIVLSLAAQAQDDFKDVMSRVQEFTLDNGWRFIVVERHQAPVASFYTYADVGSAQEVKGITGLAHMFEHMAFKGTRKIGTKDYTQEKEALERVDRAFQAIQAEKQKTGGGDPKRVQSLEQEFKSAEAAAGEFVVANEFGQIIERSGGRGLNASTSYDKTDYFFSLPSNSAELWFYLESERFYQPVFREFYKEAGVVREERRMRTESSPQGRLIEEFTAAAYKAHPYGEPVVGHMSDLESFTRADATEFFQKYYGPGNLVSVIVGDVSSAKIKALAEKYMGRIAARPVPPPLRTVEPPQTVERRLILRGKAQRIAYMGYHKPSILDPDLAVYEALSSILSDGRSSRLHQALVQKQKVAVAAAGFTGFPGQKYPGLFLFGAIPSPGKTNEDVEKAMLGEIKRLIDEPVSAEELEGVKNRARAGLINLLGNNTSMASQLAEWKALTGDWRNLFRFLDKLNAVTPQDVQRVAKETFKDSNRTVAFLEPEGN
ncbi:MAG: pitrilysin family protein [Bryobacteraceae bacterium]